METELSFIRCQLGEFCRRRQVALYVLRRPVLYQRIAEEGDASV